jgi:hypothetical protein
VASLRGPKGQLTRLVAVLYLGLIAVLALTAVFSSDERRRKDARAVLRLVWLRRPPKANSSASRVRTRRAGELDR